MPTTTTTSRPRRSRRRLVDTLKTVLLRWSARGACQREQGLQFAENPLVVPSARATREQVTAWFAAAQVLEGELWALEFRGEDPDWHGDLDEFHRRHVEPARDAAYAAAVTLIEHLAVGGRPPRRWRMQRRYRQLERLEWQLRERRWRRWRRPSGRRDPWAAAPVAGSCAGGHWDDETPF